MMEDHEVSITVPPPEEKSNVITVTGPPSNVKGAKAALEERCVILESEKQDKVRPKYHIGLHPVAWVIFYANNHTMFLY